MSDIDSTKNTDNRYSTDIFISYQTKVIAFQQHVKLYSSGSGLGFYYVIQTIMLPPYAYSHETIKGYFCITLHFSGLWEGLVQLVHCDSYKGTLSLLYIFDYD